MISFKNITSWPNIHKIHTFQYILKHNILTLIFFLLFWFFPLLSLLFLFLFHLPYLLAQSNLTSLGLNFSFHLALFKLECSLSKLTIFVSCFAPLFIDKDEAIGTFLGKMIMAISFLMLISIFHRSYTLWPNILMLFSLH